MSTVAMTLNGYDFPTGVPLLSIQENHNRTGSGKFFSRTVRATLSGHLLGFANECPTSLSKILVLEEDMRERIQSCTGCPVFEIYCDEELILTQAPRVLDITIDQSSDNWTMTAPYRIQLEWEEAPSGEPDCDTCLRQISENWSIEQLDPFQYSITFDSGCDTQTAEYYRISHSLSAAASDCCYSGTEHSGWLIAKDWVTAHASGGVDENALIQLSGLNEKFTQYMEFYEHIRSYNYSPLDGAFGLEESWVAVAGLSGGFFQEEFEISERFDRQSRFREFTVSGSIKGLEKKDPNTYNIISTRIANAESRWSVIEESGLANRLSCYFDLECPVNPLPVSYTIGKNPAAGTINFTYTYDERPAVLFSGAQYETINVSDSRSAYNIAAVPILGRMAGPLLIDTKTTNQRQKTVSISAVFPKPELSGCAYPTGYCDKLDFMEDDLMQGEVAVNQFLCCMENRLRSQYDKVYRINDNPQYDIIGGSYQRDVTWTYQKCAIPELDICSGTGYE